MGTQQEQPAWPPKCHEAQSVAKATGMLHPGSERMMCKHQKAPVKSLPWGLPNLSAALSTGINQPGWAIFLPASTPLPKVLLAQLFLLYVNYI